MAIYGIGAKYNGHEVSQIFIRDSIVATGWEDVIALGKYP